MEKLIKELKKELQFTVYFPKEGQENLYGFGFPGTITLPVIMDNSPDVIMITNFNQSAHGLPYGGGAQHMVPLTTNYCSGFISSEKWEEVKDLYYPVKTKLLTEHLTRQVLLFDKPIFVATLKYPFVNHQLVTKVGEK